MEGKLIKTENGYGLKDCELIAFVSSRRPEHKHHKLSLTNCQAIERGYDLDNCVDYFEKGKLYIQQDGVIILAGENGNNGIIIQDPLKTRGVGHYSDEWNPNAFCECSQKALEILGDKKFSEEDMKRAFEVGEDFGSLPFSSYSTSKRLNKKEFIQSLQQTEWDVEICCYVEEDSDSDSFTSPMLTNTGNPKLDANGCLILKRK